jgi:hypothetical protein
MLRLSLLPVLKGPKVYRVSEKSLRTCHEYNIGQSGGHCPGTVPVVTVSTGSGPHGHVTEAAHATRKCFMYGAFPPKAQCSTLFAQVYRDIFAHPEGLYHQHSAVSLNKLGNIKPCWLIGNLLPTFVRILLPPLLGQDVHPAQTSVRLPINTVSFPEY